MKMGFIFLLLWSNLITLSVGRYFELALIFTNDFHARIEQTNQYSAPCSDRDALNGNCYGGVSRMWTKVQELREQYPGNSLLLDAGHQLQGTLWSSHYKGLANSHFMNIMGYDIMKLGHNEFDYGLPILRRFIDDLNFPVVLSNMDAGNSIIKDSYVTSHTFLINGVKVGVVGYITTRISTIQNPASIKGLTFTDEIKAVRREARKLNSEGVQIVIAMGHLGYPMDFKVAKEVEELDIVIGGNSHVFLYSGDPPSNEEPVGEYPTVITRSSGKKALVVVAWAYGKYLGFLKVNFTLDGLKLHSWEGQPILLDSSIPEDSKMLSIVNEWIQPLESSKDETVGSSHVKLEGDNVGIVQVCRSRECSLGNVVTDAVVWSYVKDRAPSDTEWSDVGIAVWNSGGLRTNIDQGPISLEAIITALPYRNTITIVEVSRCVLEEILEHSVSVMQPPSGRYLQVSGLRVKYDLNKPVGERLVSVLVRCTKCIVPKFVPLEECGMYKVLMSAYMANGGDGYRMIPQKGRIDLGTLEEDVLSDYIKQFSPIIEGLEGRIQYVTEDTPPPSSTTPAASPPAAGFPLQVVPCGSNQHNLPAGMVILSSNGLCIT